MINCQSNTFCIIRNSLEIKKLIKLRLKQNNISLYQLCQSLNIDYTAFRLYLNTDNAKAYNDKTIASQCDVINLCDSLGIKIGIQVVVTNDIKAEAFDKNNYNKNYGTRKETGFTP